MHRCPSPCCHDCGLRYDSPAWIEAVVPDYYWNQICPTDAGHGGLLCITCMASRFAARNIVDVPVKLTAGVFRAILDREPQRT